MFLSKLCAVDTSPATTNAFTGFCTCWPIASASWVCGSEPTILNDGACVVGIFTPPPPVDPTPELAPGPALWICCIAFCACAKEEAIDKPALIELIVTNGWPAVSGLAATALAFAIPVFATIWPTDAAFCISTPAIAAVLFLPAICV